MTDSRERWIEVKAFDLAHALAAGAMMKNTISSESIAILLRDAMTFADAHPVRPICSACKLPCFVLEFDEQESRSRCCDAPVDADATSQGAGVDAEQIARLFHDTYESLAPKFGYLTRVESKARWGNVPKINRDLMVATVTEVFKQLNPPPSHAAGERDVIPPLRNDCEGRYPAYQGGEACGCYVDVPKKEVRAGVVIYYCAKHHHPTPAAREAVEE